MKFCLVVTVLCKIVEVYAQKSKNQLQKAFVGIVEVLASQNHMISVVDGPGVNNASQLAFYATAAGIPHIVAKIKNETDFIRLNSSAIASIVSLESLDKFNQQIILSPTFAMQAQLFIYSRGGTFDKIVKAI